MDSTQTNSGSDAENVPDERAGQYARLVEIGRGGQSVVWLAVDEFLGREVALKEILPPADRAQGSDSNAAFLRFLREARITSRLDHPGVVPIHELARRPNGTLFCAQKLIRGETLKSRLAACDSLEDRLTLLPHVIDACQAVAYAHSRGVIHRDLKPSNIMVGRFGETVVVDWGLSKERGQPDTAFDGASSSSPPGLTETGYALGTPGYMSPEQVRGAVAEIDERSDVFSLGVVLYEVLAGRTPFEGSDASEVMSRVREGKLRPLREVCPEAPADLAAVAERALKHDPVDRYAGAEPLAKDLVTYRMGGRVRAYEYGAWELLRRFAASHRALLTGGAIALAALLVAVAVVAVRLHETRLELASSFLERGYRAQREGDWSRAAAYFAAARAQHDTHEERWSLAVAGERITERTLSLQGPAESFVDVSVLPDGQVITLGHSLDRVEVREAESGKALWQHSGSPVLAAAFAGDGVLALWQPAGWSFHDAATGRELSAWPSDSGVPCPGRYPLAAAIADGKLMRVEQHGPPRIIATDAAADRYCAVSPDGLSAVYMDRSYDLRLVSLDDGRELARRSSDFFKAVRFSRRFGLVIFRQGQLEVIGGPEGNFTIDLPDSSYSRELYGGDPLSGAAVSPDGRLAAIASRRGTTEAMVVDLQSRSIRGVLHYAPGSPRFAFSPDGQRVFAAGMGNRSLLAAWRLPPEDLPRTPRWWSFGRLFPGGGAALAWNVSSGRYEYYKPPDTLVAKGVVRATTYLLLGDGPLAAVIAPDSNAVFLRDLEADRLVWQHACRACRDISVSYDGSVFAFVGADGLEVWDTRSDRRLFEETQRIRLYVTQCAVSRDGRRVAWSQIETAVVRDLDAGREQTVPLDGPIRQLQFSPDPERLLTVTTQTISLWKTAEGRAMWSRPTDAPGDVLSRWSPERRALILEHGYMATEVLDADTGERLAWFEALTRVVTPVAAEVYANDLRRKAVASMTHWDFRPVPPPDEEPAEHSLMRMLQRTGLVFRGVNLVAAP